MIHVEKDCNFPYWSYEKIKIKCLLHCYLSFNYYDGFSYGLKKKNSATGKKNTTTLHYIIIYRMSEINTREVIVRFVHIGGIVDHRCLYFLLFCSYWWNC